ncbi:MAG: twin-arginine translocase subunit TatC [Gammaproteobacteria bacterium]|jgi:sec-independent protein translocase protein TatC|nr:twin-arginine translocase subunit TatC [Gammaproteobacteria bacterium]
MATTPDDGTSTGGDMPLMAHLLELRSRLLRVLGVVLAVFLVLAPFANRLYTMLALPLIERMPQGTTMIATQVAAPFLVPFKFTMVLAVFLAMPYILHQVWRFVAPGLYRSERRLALPLLVASASLFYGGALFAYFVLFPLVFGFFMAVAPEGVAVMTDIGEYLGFVLTIFFAFGIAFQVPVATILLVWAGVTTPQQLLSKRPYVVVGAFVLGMLLTPPDVISQTLLALPMWGLFEIGVQVSKLYVRPVERDEAEE